MNVFWVAAVVGVPLMGSAVAYAQCNQTDLVLDMKFCVSPTQNPGAVRNSLLSAVDEPPNTQHRVDKDMVARDEYIKDLYMFCQGHQSGSDFNINGLHIATIANPGHPYVNGKACSPAEHREMLRRIVHPGESAR
jgi:hypothetical protein